MPHIHRVYAPPERLQEGTIALDADEEHHALRVARVRDGEAIEVLDGAGRIGRGVARVGTDRLRVEVEAVETIARDAAQLTLGLAWLNWGKAVEEVIRRGTELGVARFVFFRADHSERGPRLKKKWRRLAMESCKQSGNPWLPEFNVAESFDEALESVGMPCLIATQHSEPVSIDVALGGSKEAVLLIGPEGDFSEEEVAAALEHGAQAITLGPYTLRSEVAAVVGAALMVERMRGGGIGQD